MREDHQLLLQEFAALQQTLSELATIYKDAPVGLAVIGTDFRFQRINSWLAAINGLSIEDHIGRSLRDVVPALADLGERLIAKVAETGQPILNLEINGETPAEPGVFRSFVEHWSPLTDSSGKVVAVNIVAEEVTAQRRVAEALQASEGRLREVLNSIKDAFMLMDEDFRILQMNNEALRIDGRSFHDLRGRTHWEVWPASIGTPVETGYRQVMRDGVPASIEHHYVSTEHDVWLDISAYRTSEGIAVFYRDISERKRSEIRLRESESRLSTALRAGQLGVFEFNYRPAPTYYWDATVRRIWGVGPHDVITNDFFWTTVHPEDGEKVRYVTARAGHRKGPGRYDIEYRIFRQSDGDLRWVKASADIVSDAHGPLKMIGTIHDITDRKQGEEHARMLMREVNHRSKNLLAVVQSVAHQMARTPHPQAFAERLSERLAGLAASHDLLVHHQWKGIDLRALISSQLSHYQHLIGVRISLGGPDMQISASAAQNLGMAFHELATNAAKYGALSCPAGEIAIQWGVSGGAGDELFTLSWSETKGPPVQSPAHEGLGSQIVTRFVEHALEGRVKMEFDPSGLRWMLTARAETVRELQHN